MNFKGSDCKGVWHKTAGNFGGCHCSVGHYIEQSFVHGSHQNWRRYSRIREDARLHATVVRQVPEQLQANELANMLEQIFAGSPDEVMATALCFQRTIGIKMNC